MPPGCPHAVFTPEDCLAVGGHFLITSHLGSTLEALKIQEDKPDISNEDLYDQIYSSLAGIVRKCGGLLSAVEKAEILSNCSLFLDSKGSADSQDLSKAVIEQRLTALGRTFNSRATKTELAKLLYAPRHDFLQALQDFRTNHSPDLAWED
jgi:hypothetical protein